MMQGSKADSNEAIRGIILGIKKGDVIDMKKRIMSLLLVLVMVFSILPIMPARKSAAEETRKQRLYLTDTFRSTRHILQR